MAPALVDTAEGSPSNITANGATSKADFFQVNGKLDVTQQKQCITPPRMTFEDFPTTEESGPSPVSEEPQPENATVSENTFENERTKILFEAIDKLHSLGAGQLDIPQVPKTFLITQMGSADQRQPSS